MKKTEYEPYCEFAHHLHEDKWKIIQETLKKDIKDSNSLIKAIQTIFGTEIIELDCGFLSAALKDYEPKDFFEITVPFMKNLVLETDQLFPNKIKKLQSGDDKVYKFSRKESACILANSFFCTFGRDSKEYSWKRNKIPSINLDLLFGGKPEVTEVQIAKIRMILNYFTRIAKEGFGKGELSFFRQSVKNEEFDVSKMNHEFTSIDVFETGSIHDAYKIYKGCYCVDFANAYIGGASLSYGSVQEEILFVTNPELNVARLFMEKMEKNEAIIMKGAEKFSDYKGYGMTLNFGGNYQDNNFEDGQCLNTDIGIDALDFRDGAELTQYEKENIDREITKCYSGFKDGNNTKISTGNWGSGEFKGDKRLKLILQWIAASIAKKELLYYTFFQQEFAKEAKEFIKLIQKNKISVSQVYNALFDISFDTKIPNSFEELKKILKI